MGGTVTLLQRFAKTFHLPTKVVEVGPKERRVKRLVVGLNFHDWNLMREYQNWFHLESANHPLLGGVLPLEYAFELDPAGKSYVGTNVRPRPGMDKPIWMFGREDVPWSQWWDNSVMHPQMREVDPPIVGFAHLIGVSPAEQKNLWHYLYHPDDRAACKSSNCIAWQSQLEFGRTAKDAVEAERRFLAAKLGFSRTIEHSEMTRRVFHYANEEHAAVIAWLNGPKGLEAFEKNLEAHLPPMPKKSPRQAVKGIEWGIDPSIANAIAKIPDVPGGARVLFPIGPGASPEAMEALAAHAAKTEYGVDVHVFVNGVSERIFQEATKDSGGKFRIHALFLGGNLRKLHSEGRVHLIPGYLADFAKHFRDPGRSAFRYDAVIVRVSPADEKGRHSLGPNCDLVKTVLDVQNPVVIAEVNPNVPFANGDNFLFKDRILATFPSESPLPNPSAIAKTAVEEKIGDLLGALVDDGSTLQVGIGNVFGGLSDGLAKAGRRDLKISTEMMGDDLLKVLQSGMAVSAETSFGFGSAEFYRALHHNPKITLRPTEILNDTTRVASIPKFVAINTAIQVDLHGQVNATMGPPERGRISSPGGQVEFMYGASRSRGGKAIIAIRSTAKEGSISSIVMEMYPGPVTTPHEMVTHVVTEYGVAVLAGRSEKDRAIALINVAHPKFRKRLVEQALERKLITLEDLTWIQAPEITRSIVETAQRELVTAAKRLGIPAYFRKVNDRDIPVVLLNTKTYPSLKPYLDRSLSTAVKLFPFDHRGTDHGLIRLGDALIDFYWPGSDKPGQLHRTGVYWLHVPDYLVRRDRNSQRIIEASYALAPWEMEIAQYYHRARRAGAFRARYEFSAWEPAYDERPNVLSTGYENCYSFGVNASSQAHIDDMKRQLSDLGIHVPTLLASGGAKEFQRRARARLLSMPKDKLDITLLDTPEAQALIADELPKGLLAEHKRKVLSYLVGIDAVEQYQRLGAALGLGGNFWNFGHDRVTAIVVWDSEEATDAFTRAAYEEGGGNPHYQFRDPRYNRPLDP